MEHASGEPLGSEPAFKNNTAAQILRIKTGNKAEERNNYSTPPMPECGLGGTERNPGI